MNTLREEEHAVRSYEVDCTGKLRPSFLFNYFQDIAGHHAGDLGVGYDVLQRLGSFWVLSRAMLRVMRLPAWGETVILSTWPKGQEGLLFLRDFRMTSAQHGTMVLGSTGWLLLDIQTYKPHRADVLPVPLPHNDHGHAIEDPLRKLRPLEDIRPRYDRKVLLSDLDMNEHVNNAKYVEWIFDCYDTAFVGSKTLRSLQVNYVGEARLGDTVRLSMGEEAPGRHYIEGIDIAKGSRVVQALIEWVERPASRF